MSGGGARGLAHIGVIEELEKQGYEIVSIAGTSMGALVGGVYALGNMQAFKEWMISLDKLKVFRLVDFTFGSNGMIKADKVLKTMRQFVADNKIEDLKIPYVAVAADILNKEEVIFREGSVYDAIRASIAIPSVITPVKTKNGILVDGGVVNNLPINRIEKIEGSIVIAVNVNASIDLSDIPILHEDKEEKEKKYVQKVKEYQSYIHNKLPSRFKEEKEEKLSYFNFINKTINMMTYQMTINAIENYPVDLLVEVPRASCGTYDFYKAEQQIEIGRYQTQKALEAL